MWPSPCDLDVAVGKANPPTFSGSHEVPCGGVAMPKLQPILDHVPKHSRVPTSEEEVVNRLLHPLT